MPLKLRVLSPGLLIWHSRDLDKLGDLIAEGHVNHDPNNPANLVGVKGYRELITQMYFADETLNDSDLILQDLTPDEQKEVVVQFVERFDRPHPSGNFDIKIQKISNPISKGKI